MNSVKTPKGSELPLLTLKGKLYLQVAHRLVWFREMHPEGKIETSPHTITPQISIFRASIYNGDGKLLAQATKSETPEGFGDYIEKSETGAIGRALALCGFGTQFTDELDEGDRIVDAPLASPRVVQEDPRPAGYGVENSKPAPKVVPTGKKVVL